MEIAYRQRRDRELFTTVCTRFALREYIVALLFFLSRLQSIDHETVTARLDSRSAVSSSPELALLVPRSSFLVSSRLKSRRARAGRAERGANYNIRYEGVRAIRTVRMKFNRED